MEGAFESSVALPDARSAGDSPGGRIGIAAAAAVTVAAVLTGVLLGRTWFQEAETVPLRELTRFSMPVAPGQRLSGGLAAEERPDARQRPSRQSFVLSPDGRELIVFVRGGTLMAVPFDLTRLEVTGTAAVVVEDVMQADGGTNLWVYPGFPTPFWGLSGFFVGDLIGKALWELVENAQRFPRHGGRVLCVHGAVSFHRARPCATRWLPGRGPMRDVELDRCVLGLQSTGEQLCSRQHRRPVHAERSIYPGKTGISGAYAIWETRI